VFDEPLADSRPRPARPGRLVAAAAALLCAMLASGCQGPTSPQEAPSDYARLIQRAGAEARAQEDSTLLLLRNTSNRGIQDLMLGLGLDYVRYDRVNGLVCAWRGGGFGPARGYIYRLPDHPPVAADTLGETCMRNDECSERPVTDDWTGFACP
jgi:hypothetical protein